MKIRKYEVEIWDGGTGWFFKDFLEKNGFDLNKVWYKEFERAIDQKRPYVDFIDKRYEPYEVIRYNLVRRDIKNDGAPKYIFRQTESGRRNVGLREW